MHHKEKLQNAFFFFLRFVIYLLRCKSVYVAWKTLKCSVFYGCHGTMIIGQYGVVWTHSIAVLTEVCPF